MSAITKNKILSSLKNIVTDSNLTDEFRWDDNVLSDLIDKVGAQLKVADYNENKIIRREWLTDLSFIKFHRVSFADDPNIDYCECDISKAFVPKVISFDERNADLGFPIIMSACGKRKYYPLSIGLWKDVPDEHPRALFDYYDRIDTAMYIDTQAPKEGLDLRLFAVLETPEDGYVIQSMPVESGDLVAGATYIVKYKQITYNFVTIPVNGTFIAQAGLTTYNGTGSVYLADQLQQLTRNQPYPVSMNMARQIVLEICTKEFKIAVSEIPDILNDNADDEIQAKKSV